MKPTLSLLILPSNADDAVPARVCNERPVLPPLAALDTQAMTRTSIDGSIDCNMSSDRARPSDDVRCFIRAIPPPPVGDAPKSAPLPHLPHLSPADGPALSTSPPPPPLAAFAHIAEFAGNAEFRPSLDANIVYHSPSQQLRPLHPPQQHRLFRQFPQYSTSIKQLHQLQRHSEEIPRPHSSNSIYHSQQFQRPQTQLSQTHPLQPPPQILAPTDHRLSLHKTFKMLYTAASANLRGGGSGGIRRDGASSGAMGGGLGLFAAALQLQQDQQQTARAREFQCSMCPNRFLRKQDMKRHEVTHNQIKDFVCHNCGFGFVRRDALVRHVKSRRCMLQSEKLAAAATAAAASATTVTTSTTSSAISPCVEMAITPPPALELT
ncbi:hypothetical protein HDU83_001683 [Entophlyctis luteolus]|nr:hypothetical protein HDU83_001683 [Entophlyctis luteolus]